MNQKNIRNFVIIANQMICAEINRSACRDYRLIIGGFFD